MSDPHMYDLPDIISNRDTLHLGDRIAALYTDLGEDATPLLADHLEENRSVANDVKALLEGVDVLVAHLANAQTENTRLKETNNTLMYQQLQDARDKVETDPEDADVASLDEALANIDDED